jgi:translation elongation factor EF-Tu-like GTPase
MSGSIGANRIPRTAVESTLKTYVEKVLNKFPGFKTAKKEYLSNLKKGMRFAIREGGRTVGAGIVLNIIK